MSSRTPSPADAIILSVAQGARPAVTVRELQFIREHIAKAGFSPGMTYPADARVVGLTPPSGGPPLSRGDPVPVGELHYLRHVVAQREWPTGTILSDYYGSGEDLALDPRTGVLVSTAGRFGIHVAIVGRSGRNQGPGGHIWAMVEFRMRIGHWATLLQLQDGLEHFNDPDRSGKRWLRLPS